MHFFSKVNNHSSESIYILTIVEGRLSFYDSWPQGPCPGMVLEVKIYDSFKKCFYAILLILKQLKQIVGQTSVNIMPLTLGHEVNVIITFISQSSGFASYLCLKLNVIFCDYLDIYISKIIW